MFKKIEIWILYLVVLICILLVFVFGVLVRQGIEGRTELGGFSIDNITEPIVSLVRIPEQFLTYLLKPNDLVINDPWDEQRYFWTQKGFKGKPLKQEVYLLLSRYDGDLEESVVELVDLRSFVVLHTWNPDIDKINKLVDVTNPEFKDLYRDHYDGRYRINHPLLLTDGALVFQDITPLVKIDKCSNLVWQNQEDRFHHSNEQDHEGNYWVPTRIFPYAIDEKYVGSDVNNYVDDALTKISTDGNILFQKSVSEIFIENNMGYLLFSTGMVFNADPLHLNDIEPVLEDSEYWKKGDVFISLRHQSMIILYRPSTNEIIWTGTGHVSHPHDVDILDDHRISIFNNNSITSFKGDHVDGINQVVIYDFESNTYSKYLNAAIEANDIRTTTEGRSQILENGDLFIEESNYGRTLYFNADGSRQWQHVNLADNGNVYVVSWSRILYKPEDITKVKNILTSGVCNNE